MALALCKNAHEDQNGLVVVAGVHSVVPQVVLDLTAATNYSNLEQELLLETSVDTCNVAPVPKTSSPPTMFHPGLEARQHPVIK